MTVAEKSVNWYVRIPDGTVYGPVPLATVCDWMKEGRVVPGNEVSNDGWKWVPAESVHILNMYWLNGSMDESTAETRTGAATAVEPPLPKSDWAAAAVPVKEEVSKPADREMTLEERQSAELIDELTAKARNFADQLGSLSGVLERERALTVLSKAQAVEKATSLKARVGTVEQEVVASARLYETATEEARMEKERSEALAMENATLRKRVADLERDSKESSAILAGLRAEIGNLRTEMGNKGRWYLMGRDEKIYGPASLAVLCEWAAQGRVTPGCKVSNDRTRWVPAEEIDELHMDWLLELPDKTLYGPLNLNILRELVRDKSIAPDSTVIHRKTRQPTSLAGVLAG